ncbi:ABC transporter ATP-binding protein [Liquorilactobacillus mali]|uniref:ABC transporter ATP-binding protein n=1 Tax=Liquorilactobacillus mali TaxID=1618 RepID=UPI002350DBB4|nr:ABC transporter ATP-binding protein [Liquorilactobacillus mali]MDC7953134.1 ABC transporter ATP-binding protein [Liquorilactobacillus mali]
MYSILTHSISKNYKDFKAVSNVDLAVKAGEIYGFIGLNGAGKTTMMRMLLNMVDPSEGNALILGQEVGKAAPLFWNNVGYLIETPHSYPNLTVAENLDLYGKMRLIKRPIREKRINYLMDQLALTSYKNFLVKDLSLGNNQKIGLIKALIHQPKILLLDEPTNGLDPEGLTHVRHLLVHLAKDEGVTILISSHILNEMEKIFTTIGILHRGKLLRQESKVEYLKNAKHQLQITFSSVEEVIEAKDIYKQHKVNWVNSETPYQLRLAEFKDIAAKQRILIDNGITPVEWHEEVESMEEYFLSVLKEADKK